MTYLNDVHDGGGQILNIKVKDNTQEKVKH